MSRISPYGVALLLVLMVERYATQRNRNVTRVRFARRTLYRVSGRIAIKGGFLRRLDEELASLGWIFIETTDGAFAMLKAETTEAWTKISSARVAGEVADLKAGRVSEDDLALLLDGQDDNDGDEESGDETE